MFASSALIAEGSKYWKRKRVTFQTCPNNRAYVRTALFEGEILVYARAYFSDFHVISISKVLLLLAWT